MDAFTAKWDEVAAITKDIRPDRFEQVCARTEGDFPINRVHHLWKQDFTDLLADISPSAPWPRPRICPRATSPPSFTEKKSKTLSDFVRSRRMEHAAYLLSSTDIQIRTVALHCCIMDMQYFSKLFKGYHSVTPTAYRATRKRERRS